MFPVILYCPNVGWLQNVRHLSSRCATLHLSRSQIKFICELAELMVKWYQVTIIPNGITYKGHRHSSWTKGTRDDNNFIQ